MNEEMFTEIQEMVLGLIEKHSIDKASKEAQQQLQKKFGNGWNVIIGKGYGAAVTAVKVVRPFSTNNVYLIDSGNGSTVLLPRRVCS